MAKCHPVCAAQYSSTFMYTVKDMYFILIWWNTQYSTYMVYTGLCSSTARWTLAPNFCSWATRKSQIFDTNHMLDTLDFTGSEH